MPIRDTANAADTRETALVAAARDGDHDAYRQLWSEAERSVVALCKYLTGNRADALDAVQDAQLAAWRNLHRFEGRAPFRIWIMAIARNAAKDTIRRRAAASECGLDAVGPPHTAQPPFTDIVGERLDLRAAMSGLTANHREALLLWADGWTYQQIAALRQAPIGTVKVWIFRAREHLRRTLEG